MINKLPFASQNKSTTVMKGRHLNYECSNKIAVKAVLIFVLSVCPLSLLKIVMSDGRSVSTSDGSTDLLRLDTNSISVNIYHFRQCGQSAHLQRLKHIWMDLKPKRKAAMAVISVKYRLLNIRFIHLNLLSKMYIFLQINAMN